MLDFDPDALAIPCGHFIDGMLATGPGAMAVRRPCDANVVRP